MWDRNKGQQLISPVVGNHPDNRLDYPQHTLGMQLGNDRPQCRYRLRQRLPSTHHTVIQKITMFRSGTGSRRTTTLRMRLVRTVLSEVLLL